MSRTIAQLPGIREAAVTNATTVYDPTCGSGSLLPKVGEEARHGANARVKVTLCGQEKDSTTAGLARMNMILHDGLAPAARSVGNGRARDRGWFPRAADPHAGRARNWHRDYVRALLERDVQDVARVKEPRDLSRLLSLLALHTGELLNISTLRINGSAIRAEGGLVKAIA